MGWLIENFYIVAIIGFFLISALGKRGKNAGDGRQPRMPSFGGEGERPVRRGPQGEPGSRRPEARRAEPAPQAPRPAPVQEGHGPGRYDEEELESGNGYSLEHEEMNRPPILTEMERSQDSMERRMEMMQSDLDRIHSHLNRMTMDIPETIVEISDDNEQPERRNRSNIADQARNGIVWAEILGPPRAKRPMNPRR